MARSTPLSVRAVAREAFSKALRGWMHEDDLSEEDLARAVGTLQQKVSEWLDPRKPHVPGIPDIRNMPHELARRALRWAAEPHHMVVVDLLAPGTDVRCHYEHLARILSEAGGLTSEYARAVADGVVSPEERRRLLKEARELVAVLASLIHRLEGDEQAERAVFAAKRGDA